MPSINEQKYRAKLEEVLASYSAELIADAKLLANEALKNVQSGTPVEQAIDKALNRTGFFVANNSAVIDAIYFSACAGYGILPEIVANPDGIKAKLLSQSWTGDNMTLSKRLHGASKQMRTDIIDTVSASMRKQKTCTEMARELYTGYGYGTKGGEDYSRYQPSGNEVKEKVITGKDALNKAELPKYLENLKRSARSVANGDAGAYKEFEKALKQAEQQLNKLARNGAPTLAKKDGYNLVIEASKALGNGTMDLKKLETLKRKLKKQGLNSVADLNQAITDLNSKAMDKAVRVAIEERTRYHAERIARTESARAWFDGFIAENNDNPDVVAYKWVLSSRHKQLPFDVCDVYANADFGLGVGIFPKDKVPNIPVHPHCMCSLVKVYVGELPEGAKFNPQKAKNYINELSEERQKKLFGVQGAKEYSNDWTALARGHSGFGKPISRLSVNDFDLQVNFSGATITIKEYEKREEIANQLYEKFRQNNDDINVVAKNVNWKNDAIRKIKNHLFINEYKLYNSVRRFDPDYHIAIAWQRLIDGSNISEIDLVLLKHEYYELNLMKYKELNYLEAHHLANEKHNWDSVVEGGE